jgi:hypothetical protein
MNSNRKVVLGVAAASLAVILLFPPFDQYSIANFKVPVFAGFYLYFSPPAYGVVNSSLLLLEVFVVLINAGIGWLLVRDRADAAGNDTKAKGRMGCQNAVLIFAGINLVVIMLFPPLESVFALTNAALPSFEGFYFIFDKRADHTIVTTLLYLEVIFILVNAGLAWLIFRQRKPGTLSPEEARALAMKLLGGKIR